MNPAGTSAPSTIASPLPPAPEHPLLSVLLGIGRAVCHRVSSQLASQTAEQLSSVFAQTAADTIFQIDRDVEEDILAYLAAEPAIAAAGGLHLVAEGIGEETGGVSLGVPDGQTPVWRLIMDPIDGTRGIMYDKRSAWCLMGLAPNYGPDTRLSHIELAVMIELPTSRSVLSDELWAVRGLGATRQTRNIDTGHITPRAMTPSRATNLIGGFGQLARFFPPGRAWLAALEDELITRLYPEQDLSRALTFEDQYISTGGQLYQILVGHDRYVADIRGTLSQVLIAGGGKPVFVCHPYDICTQLIAHEAGVVVCDAEGHPVDAPLDLETPIDWVAIANPTLTAHLWPVLSGLLSDRLAEAGVPFQPVALPLTPTGPQGR